MNLKFLELPEEKQKRILNAAMKEFAQKGYDAASTNEMVKEAGISKGLLFHYFKNKKSLYFYLFEYCIELMMKEIYSNIDIEEQDFFVKIDQVSKGKWRVIQKYPQLFLFIERVYFETSKNIKMELETLMSQLSTDKMVQMFYNVDESKFRDGVDLEKAIKLVQWTTQGMFQEYAKRGDVQYDQVFKESEMYLHLLQKLLYK